MAIEPAQKQQDLAYTAEFWRDELARYTEQYEGFCTAGRKIIQRYKDERRDSEGDVSRFNILWSNVRILKPAIYAKAPKVEVSRRNRDRNDVARVASMVLERAIQFELTQYPDFHSAMSNSVEDRLLPGRGVSWVRYEPEFASVSDDELEEIVTNERSPCDYVFWGDFAHDPARTWEEVSWVARRVFMTRKEGTERFGDAFADVPLTHSPEQKESENKPLRDEKKTKAVVWEIWCKPSKTVYWIAKDHDAFLDERPDPMGFEGFFPCPKPLFATVTTDSLIPTADFRLYQDQATEIDEISARIRHLTKCLKVAGVYAADEPALARLMKEGADGVLVPVTNWPAFMEKGGMSGAVSLLPLKEIVGALQQLYVSREACKQTIYEITGISDILRGASQAQETATAQQIKSQFASIRLNEMKEDVQRYARDLLRLKAEVICTKYQPETILMASGIANTQDRELAPQAIALLKSDPLRSWSIDIETDSLVEMDQTSEKQERMEFLAASSQFLDKTIQAAQIAPDIMPLANQMLLFGVRGFKIGRELEGEFERFTEAVKNKQEQAAANPQPPPPDPEMLKLQAQAAESQANMQLEQQKMQLEQQVQAASGQMEAQKLQFEAQLEQQKLSFEKWKAELEAQTKIQIAQMQIEASMREKRMDKNSDLVAYDEAGEPKPSPTIQSVVEQVQRSNAELFSALVDAMNQSNSQQTQAIAALADQMSRPRTVQRGPDGRIAGLH